MCVPGDRAASLPSPLTRIRLLADVQSLLIIRPSINLTAHSRTFTNVASILFYFLFPLLTRLTPSCSCCKVSIMCALRSAHSGPHDACVAAVDDSTRQCPAATPSHATPPPRRPPSLVLHSMFRSCHHAGPLAARPGITAGVTHHARHL